MRFTVKSASIQPLPSREERAVAGRPHTGAIAIVLAVVTAALLVDTLVRRRGNFDYDLIRAVRRLDFPGIESVLRATSGLTGSEFAGIWAISVVAFFVSRRWLVATALMSFPAAGAINAVLREVVGRTRPDGSAIGGSVGGQFLVNDWQSFPSGHVVGAVLLYGFFFLLAGEIRHVVLRSALRFVCIAVIFSAGLSRVWLGHHWVGDVVGAYALGGLVLIAVRAAYRSMAPTMSGLPLVHAATVPHDEALPHAHALTSTILFRDGEVQKIYNPGFVPRLAYWLSFQAPFGYAHNIDAIDAAVLRRNLAGALTEYWYGSRRVAKAVGHRTINGRLAVVGIYTDGHEPTDHHAAREFLFDIASRFDAAGLPTWQIDPRQPRSLGNLVETRPGEYTVIDLESGMVSPLQSPRAWLRGIRRSEVPLYDDVFFDVTRAYVAREAEDMRAKMGADWFAELADTLERAEAAATKWHDAEPRIWSRFLRAAWSGFGVRTAPGWLRAKTDSGRTHADQWINDEIDRWENEGRFTPEQAAHARAQLEDPGVQAVLPHFGVHLLIGIALRFPFGSIARVTYVTCNLVWATARFGLGRSDVRTWKRQVGIHSPLVILIAAMPGIGTFAYLASWPILANHHMLRVSLDAVGERLPGRLYEKTGLRRLITRPARGSAGQQSGNHDAV